MTSIVTHARLIVTGKAGQRCAAEGEVLAVGKDITADEAKAALASGEAGPVAAEGEVLAVGKDITADEAKAALASGEAGPVAAEAGPVAPAKPE